MVTNGVSVSGEGVEGEDEEVDFGYWEKAELPAQESALTATTAETDTHTTTTTTADSPSPDAGGSKDAARPAAVSRDMDLSLL